MTTNISSYNLSERQVQLDLSVLPYDFEENVKTLSEQARQAWNDVQDLEASACPDNKAQITITMHPSFASQIYFPEEFLLVMGLDCVGVRQVHCFPRDTSSCDTEDGEITVALVCVGKRQDIQAIPGKLEKLSQTHSSENRFEPLKVLKPSLSMTAWIFPTITSRTIS